MFSLSEENYLKAILHLQKTSKSGVSTNAIAEEMQTKASSVTDMVKKLSEKDLVIYKKYQGVYLSDTGRKTALQIVRKHRLWEVFLVDKLSFSWDEVHEVAEQLEHIKSDKLITELDKFLEFPKRDPHGDPIPDAKGNFHVANKTLLSNLSKGERGTLVGVKDTSTEFLKYLDKNNIALGKTIEVLDKEEFDESMLIQTGGKTLRISPMVTVNIFIKQ
ncbi:metal-dependent transcriptional regulator [Psychroflexus gondwanensis]|jgi:DtxR family Mn-dependent transcriptional regulator|uniref:Transcriptional regulator MntR n=1 Tax=Psychroflexus gondwanensis ACAM 44 TaxID=1189619 RepID=N1WQ15_9FLAO|nr:metal-dependent transcriptional regulator [Psychroflexus gondwanensis]EMY81060.1 Fe or Mn-dependent transcriptional regulator, TroR family protein [Psychroflexus gondwanensis ACAM 44]TXE17744.1 metal-dependent transcriptional regulator [Psychroflexus gondwanensis]